MRWTTFTQLPLVFSAGNSEKLDAAAWAYAFDRAGPLLAGIGIDLDPGLLSGPDERQFGFLRARLHQT
jgi:hypothetical protein